MCSGWPVSRRRIILVLSEKLPPFWALDFKSATLIQLSGIAIKLMETSKNPAH